MLKNKLDYKLVNFLLLGLIFLIVYITRSVWLFLIDVLIEVLKPIVISLIISYVFNLYLKKLNIFFSKSVSVFVFLITIFLFIFILYKLFGQIVDQVGSSFSIVMSFIKDVLVSYDLDFFDLYSKVFDVSILFSRFIGNIFNYITLFVVIISSSIYMFIDFDKIKSFFRLLPSKVYSCIRYVNRSIEAYTYSFLFLCFVNVLEYLFVFRVIGHPNYLFLGFLAGILSVVPVFGGLVTNCIALVISFMVDYRLFIRALIGILFLTILDGYVVSPFIYGKSNRLHPLMIILSIYIGGKLFGIFGVVFSVPLLVVFVSIYKFLKKV